MTVSTHTQLPLELMRQPGATFDRYVSGQNAEALAVLQQAVDVAGDQSVTPAIIFLWGERGTGKTHLLQASCDAVARRNVDSIYIDCRSYEELRPDIFEGLESSAVVVLDSVDSLAGMTQWEEALFAFLRRHREGSGLLVLSATRSPRQLGFNLPDLQTRLVGWSMVYQLKQLDDDARAEAIKQHSEMRGLEISEEVIRYILQRYPRDMHAIFSMLDDFDRASLAQQRKITIPFLKSLKD